MTTAIEAKAALAAAWSVCISSAIFIANLSFMDVESKSIMNAGDAQPVNEAVEFGMHSLSTQDPKYVINDKQHSIPNTDATAKKLSDIYWDANMIPKEKFVKIVDEMMAPLGLDGLVSGQFHARPDGSISVRPFVISRVSKSMVTEARVFKKAEFECKDAKSQKRELCQGARDEIKDVVIRLMKQLPDEEFNDALKDFGNKQFKLRQ